MTDHKSLPVSGYRPQSDEKVSLVNENKRLEEGMLRQLDKMKDMGTSVDQRWLATGRTQLEKAFMSINRAVFQPERVKLPEDMPTTFDDGPTAA